MVALKTVEEIAKIRAAGSILARVLGELASATQSGVTETDLNRLAVALIKKAGAEAAFYGYQPGGAAVPFPAALCVSVNDVVVHGIPTKRRLREGDVVKLDLGVRHNGYCADSAVTVLIEPVNEEARSLVFATRRALEAAVGAARPGNTLGDIGAAVSATASERNFYVLRELTGHGIGREVHEEPTIVNYGEPGHGMRLAEGMVLALEPMLSAGTMRVRQLHNGSYATVDGSIAAHFEHTIAVTARGAEILTVR